MTWEELLGYWAANGKVGALHNQLGRVRTDTDRRDLVRLHPRLLQAMGTARCTMPIQHVEGLNARERSECLNRYWY